MANLKFSQFTEQTDTANVQFLVGYNGSTNVRIAPGNIGGTVTSVTTGDANTITIGGTAAAPTVAANTAAVTNGSLNLATGDQIYDFVIAQNYTSNTGTVTDFDTISTAIPGITTAVTNSTTTPELTISITGTPTSAQYLDGTGNWSTPAGGGGSGTVTSVAATHAGNAFTATIGNVSTVNPSVDITLNGSSSQYINGAGDLTTFPTITTGTVESVGLSMPAAFSVANSPVTTSGTLTVTGAGTTSQYVDGTGALQTFPTIPTVPANIVETVTTTDGTFINLTPNTATDGAVTVTADLSATGTPNSSSYLRGDNQWATIPGGFTSFDITGGSGSAQTITDGNTITLAQGTGISTVAGATDTVTITNTDRGSSQNIFKNFAVSGQPNVVADSNNDTLTLAAGSNVTITTNAATDTITIASTDTTYTAGTGLTLSGTTFNANVDGTQTVAANTSTTTAARTYNVQVDSSDNLVVNVPWTAGSGGIAGTIAAPVNNVSQIAYATAADTIGGEAGFTYDTSLNTLSVEKLIATDNITVGQEIYHAGDTNTYIQFTTDTIKFVAGAKSMIESTTYGSPDRVVINEGGQDIDFRVEGFGATHLLYADAFNQKVGINQSVPAYTFDVNGDAKISGTIVDSTNSAGSNNDVLTSTGSGWSWQPAGGGATYPFSTDGTNSLYSGFVPTGTLTGVNNTILGIDAGSSITSNDNNTLIGYGAGRLVTASQNTIVGSEAAFNATGSGFRDNVIIGERAAYSSASNGDNAVVIGKEACYTIANDDVVAIGSKAGYSGNTNFTVSIGTQAGYNGLGTFSQAIGYQAGYTGDSGYGIFIGHQAGRSSTGFKNTLIGHEAGYYGTNPLTTGSNNTILGAEAAVAAGSAANTIIIGYRATSYASNSITLGNSSITNFYCATQTISSLSDSRDKTNIQKSSYGLDIIEKLNPVTFEWDQRDGGKKGLKDLGFIAQELQQSDDEYLKLVDNNDPERLQASYGRLIPVMVKAIQELQEEIKNLKNK